MAQIGVSFAFGYFVDVTETLIGNFTLPGYGGKLVMLATSIILMAVGIVFYVDVDLIPMPMEGLVFVIAEKSRGGRTFREVKLITDVFVVVVSATLSLLFLGELRGVREGTILSALLISRAMKPAGKVLHPIMDRLIR